MAYYVWEDAEGQLNITSLAEGADPAREFALMEARGDRPKNAKTVIVDTLPDLAQQHKWRFAGETVVVDATVPDRPHPRRALIQQARAAATVADVAALLEKVIRGDTT